MTPSDSEMAQHRRRKSRPQPADEAQDIELYRYLSMNNKRDAELYVIGNDRVIFCKPGTSKAARRQMKLRARTFIELNLMQDGKLAAYYEDEQWVRTDMPISIRVWDGEVDIVVAPGSPYNER